MCDTLELFPPLCNWSVRMEARSEKLTGNAGFLLLREALDHTALIGLVALHVWKIPRIRAESRTQLAVATACQPHGDRLRLW